MSETTRGDDAVAIAHSPAVEELLLNLDGYEGPISVLLALARDQKVDLKQISIAALTDQYLAFVTRARYSRIELAADYLVMAAWLAFLKSRLLLPEPPAPEEPDPEDLAEALRWRLQRLSAMRMAAGKLDELPRLWRDVHSRGTRERIEAETIYVYSAAFTDLLKAYGDVRGRGIPAMLQIAAPTYYTVSDALQRLSSLLGTQLSWRQLEAFLPPELAGYGPGGMRTTQHRSVLAATLVASLELARDGRLELRQDHAFGPILIRALDRDEHVVDADFGA